MTVQIDGDGNHHIAGRDVHHETHQHFYVEHCVNVKCRVPLVRNEKDYCYVCRAKMDQEKTIGNVVTVLVFSAMLLYWNTNFANFIGLAEHSNIIALILYLLECVFFIWIWLKLK